jgi:hypothetical protein
MDFLFHVPFFCTAAGAVAEIQTVCLVNIEFCEQKKLILNQVKRASHFVKVIMACPDRLPKLPESTQRKQAIPNKGSLSGINWSGKCKAVFEYTYATYWAMSPRLQNNNV